MRESVFLYFQKHFATALHMGDCFVEFRRIDDCDGNVKFPCGDKGGPLCENLRDLCVILVMVLIETMQGRCFRR